MHRAARGWVRVVSLCAVFLSRGRSGDILEGYGWEFRDFIFGRTEEVSVVRSLEIILESGAECFHRKYRHIKFDRS